MMKVIFFDIENDKHFLVDSVTDLQNVRKPDNGIMTTFWLLTFADGTSKSFKKWDYEIVQIMS